MCGGSPTAGTSSSFRSLPDNEFETHKGQELVEYALLITFIALACTVGMQQLGTAINNRYNSISTSLAS